MEYLNLSCDKLNEEKQALLKSFEDYKGKGLNLNMARGKPADAQLDLSMGMLDVLTSKDSLLSQDGTDCRNYGVVDGIAECKELFAQMLQVDAANIFVGGNASLNMMFDAISCFMTKSIYPDTQPWLDVKDRKFLCPVPGYDRHFGITEYYGFKMIPVPMTENGPDMDMVEELVSNDDTIKGIWCVPKYSNPQGITYCDETVKRFSALKPAAKDFRIMWDNAYCIHDVTDTPDTLLSLYDECKKTGNEDLPLMFCSTSKVTFAGAGVSAMAASPLNMKILKERYNFETIGYDKVNMLRHVKFFKNYQGVLDLMNKHKEILAPKFNVVLEKLNNQLGDTGIAKWCNPNGGYFVSVDLYPGTAKRTVALCKEAGVTLTGAGAVYPYGIDPQDSTLRIAPSFPTVEELSQAMDIFCVCAKLATIEKLLQQ